MVNITVFTNFFLPPGIVAWGEATAPDPRLHVRVAKAALPEIDSRHQNCG